MIYIVYYVDDEKKTHMTFAKSIKDLTFLRDRFGEITIESYEIK